MPYLAVNLIFFFYLHSKLANDTFGNFNKISGFGSMAKVPISMRETLSKAFTKSIIGDCFGLLTPYILFGFVQLSGVAVEQHFRVPSYGRKRCAIDGRQRNKFGLALSISLSFVVSRNITHPTIPPSLSFNGAELSATAT